ncbi:MAG: cytochrome c3 family protein [Acidobacteriota bacterium]
MLERPEQPTTSQDAPLVRRSTRRLSLLVLLIGIAVFVLAVFSGTTTVATTKAAAGETPELDFAAIEQGGDFSKFSHRQAAHTRLPCLLCHRRETNLIQPKRPGHTPCAGCHAEQFANQSSPICTICHSNPATANPEVKAFPRLASFNMKFAHTQHRNVNCSVCHKPTGRGNVALSMPSGFNAHTVCYQCHTSRAQSGGRDISSCGTCHQLGSYRRASIAAKAFRVNFSHAKHGRRQQLNCNECHQVKSGASRQQVTSPLPTNHLAPEHALSCMSCHNGKRAFGGDDFKSCQKCHTGQTFRF